MHNERTKEASDEDGVTLEELNDEDEVNKESVFREAKEKTPPDQMSQLTQNIQ